MWLTRCTRDHSHIDADRSSHPPLLINLFFCVFFLSLFFFFNDTATTEIYTLSLHDALPILSDPSYNTGNVLEDFLSDTENFDNGYAMAVAQALSADDDDSVAVKRLKLLGEEPRSEEHTSELQSRLHLVCRLLLEKKNKK